MNYLDLLKLNLSFKNTFEDINNINNTHTENIYLSECATNLSKMLASYLFNQKKQNIIYITPSIILGNFINDSLTVSISFLENLDNT